MMAHFTNFQKFFALKDADSWSGSCSHLKEVKNEGFNKQCKNFITVVFSFILNQVVFDIKNYRNNVSYILQQAPIGSLYISKQIFNVISLFDKCTAILYSIQSILLQGKGLFATKSFQPGEVIFEEVPLVCCQFSWNKDYGYLACDHCMR